MPFSPLNALPDRNAQSFPVPFWETGDEEDAQKNRPSPSQFRPTRMTDIFSHPGPKVLGTFFFPPFGKTVRQFPLPYLGHADTPFLPHMV